MNRHDIATQQTGTSAGLHAGIDGVARRMTRIAAHHSPELLRARLEEEWLAHLAERTGRFQRLGFALGCYWAAMAIGRERGMAEAPTTTGAARGSETMTAYAYQGMPLFPRRPTAGATAAVVCEINTTPLIDVMLVLLVTLIVALPIMTHAVKLDLPQATLPPAGPRPEVIAVDIELDGTITWNDTVTSLQQLDGYFHTEAGKDVQPEIHLRPDRGARYDVVAKVLASAQRNRMRRVGFVNTGEFKE
jgi:biopolymer transport protein ExbD